MKQRKKNTFFTFIFSFIPGTAEMYMGFMKSGLSILTLFFIPILIGAVVRGADYLAIISGIVYIAAFFHARNIATAPDEEFNALEDRYIWEEFTDGKVFDISTKTWKKWMAYALIFIGISGVWELVTDIASDALSHFSGPIVSAAETALDSIPRLVFSIIVIIAGAVLIKGKKKELNEGQEEHE